MFYFFCNGLKPVLLSPCSPLIAAASLMVGQILVVDIPFGNAKGALCVVGVPAYKVDGVSKMITIGPAIA